MASLVIVMTLGGMDYEACFPMPDIETCVSRIAENWKAIKKQHPDATVGIGCADPMPEGDPT